MACTRCAARTFRNAPARGATRQRTEPFRRPPAFLRRVRAAHARRRALARPLPQNLPAALSTSPNSPAENAGPSPRERSTRRDAGKRGANRQLEAAREQSTSSGAPLADPLAAASLSSDLDSRASVRLTRHAARRGRSPRRRRSRCLRRATVRSAAHRCARGARARCSGLLSPS